MIFNDARKFLNEHLDFVDDATRKVMIEADDHEQNQLLLALTSKLYDQIVAKVDDIDFGTIPRSRGDITKIENYSQLSECVDIIRGIVVESKQDTRPVDIVSNAIGNLKQRTAVFSKAFALGVEMPILLYNTIALGVVSSVSFLIATCIEFVKNPGATTFDLAVDKVAYSKTRDNLLFENLNTFNEGCKNGGIDAAIDHVIKNNRIRECGDISAEETPKVITVIVKSDDGDKEVRVNNDEFKRIILHDGNDNEEEEYEEPLKEGLIGDVTFALMSIVKLIIPIIRSLVFFFFNSKQKVHDYFIVQAELLEMNATKLQYNSDISEDERKEIYDKQMRIASNMRKIGNKFAINYSKSKKNTDKMIADDEKKYTVNELPTTGTVPAVGGANTSSILF